VEYESFRFIREQTVKAGSLMKFLTNNPMIKREFLPALVAFTVLALCLVGLSACAPAAPKNPTVTPTPIRSAQANTIQSEVVPVRYSNLSFASVANVEAILAAEGSLVKKGDVIARLEGADQAKAAVSAAELQIVTAQQALDNLNEKARLAAADAQTAVANAQTELKDATDRRNDLNYSRVNQYTLEGIQAQLILAQNAVKDAEDAFGYVSDLPEDNPDRAQAMLVLSQARIQRDQIQRNLNYASGAPDVQDVGKADARLVVAKAALEDAQRTFDRVKNGPDPRDLALAQAKLNNAQAQLQAAKANLADLEMVAPFDGTVVDNPLKVGEIAGAGTVVVLGDLNSWQIQTTDLKEVDVIGIKPSDPTKVHFDAIPDLVLDGKVNRVNGLGQDKHGDILYTVVIDLTGSDPRLLWKMTARVNFTKTVQ
jgi:HlyD family secretion protein